MKRKPLIIGLLSILLMTGCQKESRTTIINTTPQTTERKKVTNTAELLMLLDSMMEEEDQHLSAFNFEAVSKDPETGGETLDTSYHQVVYENNIIYGKATKLSGETTFEK